MAIAGIPAGYGRSNLDWAQSALESKLWPVESPLPKERLPPEPPIILEDAEIRWGRPSNFSFGKRQGPNIKYTVRIQQPGGDDGEEEEQEVPTLTYEEVEGSRKVETIRVTAEDDPDVWVEVDRITEIAFLGPSSLQDPTPCNHLYRLKHPPAPGT